MLTVCLEETDSLVLRGHRAPRVSEGQWGQLVSRVQGDCLGQWGLQGLRDPQDNRDNKGSQSGLHQFLWALCLCRMRQ